MLIYSVKHPTRIMIHCTHVFPHGGTTYQTGYRISQYESGIAR